MIQEWAEKWDVDEWDVMNEPRGNHDIQDIVGYNVEKEWFELAKRYVRNKGARLCFNDNRIISDCLRPREKRKGTPLKMLTKDVIIHRDRIARLLQEGAPMTFVGFQSRFHARIPPEILYERLCVFDQFNLPIEATEFEISTEVKEEKNKAAVTEEVMTVYFSHKLVDGIFAWTLFPDRSNDREILDSSGRPNLRGKVWLYLMKNHWSTRVAATTGANGETPQFRAFKGKYKITVTTPDGKTKITEADALSDTTIDIRI